MWSSTKSKNVNKKSGDQITTKQNFPLSGMINVYVDDLVVAWNMSETRPCVVPGELVGLELVTTEEETPTAEEKLSGSLIW